jgi:hypothetical protein
LSHFFGGRDFDLFRAGFCRFVALRTKSIAKFNKLLARAVLAADAKTASEAAIQLVVATGPIDGIAASFPKKKQQAARVLAALHSVLRILLSQEGVEVPAAIRRNYLVRGEA